MNPVIQTNNKFNSKSKSRKNNNNYKH